MKYDAFISYRHLPLDKAVATRLQNLLENYRPPRNLKGLKTDRIHRVFRDQSELPTSSDLRNDIIEALAESNYLIVICSEATKESIWCMEEIKRFKDNHQGRTDHILTLLVSGEPADAFPDLLKTEIRTVVMPDGTSDTREIPVEPLCADVRADTASKSLRLLKTEFLRIAAPLLGCGYDQLYQRHERRKRRQIAIVSGGSAAVFLAVLLVVSGFAYRTWISEGNYREALTDIYIQNGLEDSDSENIQEALAYYTEALALDSDNSSASVGVAFLLQNYMWPVLEETEAGTLSSGEVIPATVSAGSVENDRYLTYGITASQVTDGDGNVLEILDTSGMYYYENNYSSMWTFYGDGGFLFYCPASGVSCRISVPDEFSSGYAYDGSGELLTPSAVGIGDNYVLLTSGGMVFLYQLDDEGNAELIQKTDLAYAFPTEADSNSITGGNSIYLSEDGAYAAVTEGGHVAVYSAKTLSLTAVVEQYFYGIMDVKFSSDNTAFAIAYGNTASVNSRNTDSYFEVYDSKGELQYASESSIRDVFTGIAFSPLDSGVVMAWTGSSLGIWNWESGEMISAQILKETITDAAFSESGVLLDGGAGTVERYTFRKMAEEEVVFEGELPDGAGTMESLESTSGMYLVMDGNKVLLQAEDGQELASSITGQYISHMALSSGEDRIYVYNKYLVYLAVASVDFEKGILGEFMELDTGGEMIADIWFCGDCVAAETSSGRLILYDNGGEILCRILPEGNGNIQAVISDSEGKYLAVILRTYVSTIANSYHFDTCGTIELWDVQSGRKVFSCEDSTHAISNAEFTDEGKLIWSSGSDSAVCQIVCPETDENTIAFLRDLCCVQLDEEQQFNCKEPLETENPPGSWSDIFEDWEKIFIPGA
ncbi:MAG: toll/interleukin-1 receptor domain-containing protein [Lachnospiraceae bacterium]|nr:toll/interleukin-1 receptor domain-containing protein [Lachnospiraceae bacterium]